MVWHAFAFPAEAGPSPLSHIFFKVRLADHIFRLIFGLAESTRKVKNLAENMAEHDKIWLRVNLQTHFHC